MSSGQRVTPAPSRRIDGIDFWRGLVLCTIFINHVPGNLFEFATQKNYGFSDSAEAFVFLSGLSLAVAYAPRFRSGQAGRAVGSIARRAVRLYGIHIVLSLAGMAIFAAGSLATGTDALMEAHGRDLFVDDPRAALIGLFSLGHQLGYFNILPLYVLLLAPAAAMLWLGSRRPWLMLAGSFTLYAAARFSALNIPTWPMKGAWFFDPFTWQFMMGLGLCAGLALRRRPLPRPWWLIVAAGAVVGFGAACVSNGLGWLPGLEDWASRWADLDKTVLGVGRIVHFAATAYLVATLDIAGWLRNGVLFNALCRLGRNSLWTFALLSLLAAMGQVLVDYFGHSTALDGVLILGGLAMLYGAAGLLESRRPRAEAAVLITRP